MVACTFCPKRKVTPNATHAAQQDKRATGRALTQPRRSDQRALPTDKKRVLHPKAVNAMSQPSGRSLVKTRLDQGSDAGRPTNSPSARIFTNRRAPKRSAQSAARRRRTDAEIDKILTQPLVRWLETAENKGRCAVCNRRIIVEFNYMRWNTVLLNDEDLSIHRCIGLSTQKERPHGVSHPLATPRRKPRIVHLSHPTNQCPNCGNLLAVYPGFRTCLHCGS